MKSFFGGLIVLALILAASSWVAAGDEEKKAVVPEKEQREQLLKTVGSLAAANLYQSYLNIGLIADGKAEGTYEEKDIQQILGSVVSLLESQDKQLEAVSKFDLPKEDQDAIDNMRKLSTLLHKQSDDLQEFWKTGTKASSQRYEKNRKEAWEGISKLLGLDKPKPKSN